MQFMCEEIVENSKYIIFSNNYSLDYFKVNCINPINLDSKSLILKQGLYNIPKVMESHCKNMLNFKTNFNIPTDKKIILGIGEDHKRKGYIYFRELSAICPDFFFLWVGGTKYNRKMTSNFIILNSVNSDDIWNYLLISDIFFLSSIEDPFPSVILEAMSIGLPIICFRGAGGSEEIITDKNGFISDSFDINKVKNFIYSLSEDDYKKYYLNNIKLIKDKFNFQDYATKIYCKLYD
jgi:glycosyltransferase involved in cell wall biosynthesis